MAAHRVTYHESFGNLFTTHTPRYVGLRLDAGIWPAASYGQDVIIEIIDIGIWPGSESFNDWGMSPVPERWNGMCKNGTELNPSLCNRKLIGAKSDSKGLKAAGRNIGTGEYDSRRDSFGHGTHTASTAAGAYVPGADYFGYAEGTSAITNEVDIIILSRGFDQTPYHNDFVALDALSAIEKGIFVTCAAGNEGEMMDSTYNGAPWIMTVGAGTINRAFLAKSDTGKWSITGREILLSEH